MPAVSRVAARLLLLAVVAVALAVAFPARSPAHGYIPLCNEPNAEQNSQLWRSTNLVADLVNWNGTTSSSWHNWNWQPKFSCIAERLVGGPADGGKWVCDPACSLQRADCLVLSFGSNNDFTFESSVLRLAPACSIHTFDHTVDGQGAPTGVAFHKQGIAGSRKTATKQLRSLVDTVAELGLNGRRVDVLKLDVEGFEYVVLRDPATLQFLREHVMQLLVEFQCVWGGASRRRRTHASANQLGEEEER